jgi:plasmid maintenance system antidote protein VapI
MGIRGHHRTQPKASRARYVGVAIAQELEARRWTARQLAARMDVPEAVVWNLLGGGVITRAAANGLASAFGTSPRLWLEADLYVRNAAIRRQGY